MVWLKRILWGVLTLVVLIAVAGVSFFYWFNSHGGTPIRQAGLTGLYYLPPGGAKHHTAVLILGGSNGGYPYDAAAQSLADAGYPTLGLAYFKNFTKQPRRVPEYLADIPLEYFFHAIDWMKQQPEIDPNKIVLMGESRGGELVLLLAAHRPDVAGVIAYSPSHVAWGGIEPTWSKPAWTLSGAPVAYLSSTYKRGDTFLGMFHRALSGATPQQLEAATIPVEKIHGPVLLISSRSDNLWPSADMANTIEARLKAHNFAPPIQNLQFNDSSHLLMGYGPGIVKLGIPFMFTMDFGGSEEGTRKARDAGWVAAKDFLNRIEHGEVNAAAR